MPHQNIGVFYDSDTVRYHLSRFKNHNPLDQCKLYNQVESITNGCNVAILHIPYPLDHDAKSNFETQVHDLLTKCEHVYIICTELHPPTVDFIASHDDPRITYYICGFLNFKLEHSIVHQFMDWFETSTYFYKHYLPEILNRLKPYESKRRAFDVLLGRKKQHRDYLYNLTKQDPYRHIVTYFDDENTCLNNNDANWVWEWPGLQVEQDLKWTVDRVKYYGYTMSLSQIIPINVYNNTAYSVVAETCWQDHFAFYTEKTSKPIIARRLFVVFAGQNYLSNLRKLGFQTFGDIIDESYDTEYDALVRWQRTWDQMQWLAAQPQELILQKIQPIVEHNFKTMMSTDWYDKFITQLEQDVARIIFD